MEFLNPPAQEGYYWVDIQADPLSRCILYFRPLPKGAYFPGWALSPWGATEFSVSAIAVRSERLVWQPPAPPAATAPQEPATAPDNPATAPAPPNATIDAITDAIMRHVAARDIAAISVALVTSEDQILTAAAANPGMGSQLLAGAVMVKAKVLRAVENENGGFSV